MNDNNIHKAKLKHKFKQDFKTVQGMVNEFDPCGLIHVGAPIDEYDCLTSHILSAIYSGKTRKEIKNLILQEIETHFGVQDIEALTEPHKTKNYNDIEKLIDKLEQDIEK